MSPPPIQALPETGTGTPPGNVDGQAIAITVFSTLRSWGPALLRRVAFAAPKAMPQVLLTLRRLSFIHFARWTIFTGVPANGPGHPARTFTHPHLYFESNFNGGWEEYIDAFSYVLDYGMTLFWSSSYGFPGPNPTAPFKEYIQSSDLTLVAKHFYAAYPEATVTMVEGAIALDPAVRALAARAPGMTPEAFLAAFDALLAKEQRWF